MTSPASTSAILQNVYYERKTGTARPCYICHRPTTTVLATLKTEDFLYTCEGHLLDAASPISPPTPAASPGPSAEDIKKVIAEHQAREARKAEKGNNDSKDKDKEGAEDKDKVKNKDKDKDQVKSPASNTPSIPTATSPSPSPSQPPLPAPTHKKYALHRHIFEMRKNELKRKEMGNKAKEVSRGLPQVPRTGF
ncbi:uncharacterized protein I303_104052 [Kwoniella dejecticola CBS 10117]|uniref:VPS4-associated protein 1 n=1 Tax=Kwoniella dejecticola CBS 10117 TaxID=1296121 RepID=A0AAJ8KPI8_9TREE